MKPVTGVITPMVTPLRDARTLDLAGTERLVEHLVAGGVAGLFLLGTTGEGAHLPPELRRRLVSAVCRMADARLPVLVGLNGSVLDECLEFANFAAAVGADAVVAAPPSYFPLTQDELLAWFTALAERQPLPLFLYNMPALTKTVIEPATARRLAAHPGIVGIKDSSGDMPRFNELCALKEEFPDFSVFMGPDEALAAAVFMGADGGVNSGSNLAPALFAALHRSAAERDAPLARKLQQTVLEINRRLYAIGDSSARIAAALKTALALRGICAGSAMTEPFAPPDEHGRGRVAECLRLLPD